MKRLLMAVLVTACFAETPLVPFEFKGDVLGETLQEFRTKHDAILAVPQVYKKVDRRRTALHFPQCTDDPEVVKDWLTPSTLTHQWTEEETRAGVIKCIATREPQTVAGARLAQEVVYRFFQGRLYSIRIQTDRSDYAVVRDAFIAKYGKPDSTETVNLANALGGVLTGERVMWVNSVSAISIGEIDGQDGWANPHRYTRVLMLHTALNAAVNAVNAKGREKDL